MYTYTLIYIPLYSDDTKWESIKPFKSEKNLQIIESNEILNTLEFSNALFFILSLCGHKWNLITIVVGSILPIFSET